MNTKTFYFTILLCISSITAQAQYGEANYPHIPLTHYHDHRNCLGYAAVKAFQAEAGTTHGDECDATQCYINELGEEYFQFFDQHTGTLQELLDGVSVGDMMKFSSGEIHFVYITSKFTIPGRDPDHYDSDEVLFSAVESYDGPYTNGTIREAIEGNLSKQIGEHGNPDSYWTLEKNPKIKAENYFVDVSHTGGEVKIDGVQGSSPKTSSQLYWDSNHYMETLEVGKSHAGYVNELDHWTDSRYPNQSAGNTPTISHRTDWWTGTKTFTAHLAPLLEITFQNDFTGGTIEVDDTTRSSPHTKTIFKGREIEGRALNQTIDGIVYTFDEWSDDHPSASRTETPSTNKTYTANFIKKPVSLYFYDLHVEGDPGDYVTLVWDEHPNANVSQYQVWRKVKHNGQVGNPSLLTTLNRGTTEYVDTDYKITESYTDDICYYDVRAYYDNGEEQAYADEEWIDIFGETSGPKRSEPVITQPFEFEIAAYPNPFNPETTIRYRLKERAIVTLTIIDMLGRNVATIAEGERSEGFHSIGWFGKDAAGNSMPSGVYFYRFTAIPKSGVDIVRESGKLMLVK